MVLPTLHHGVNQSRLDYQIMNNETRNSILNSLNNNTNNMNINDSNNDPRLNKSRLLDYNVTSNYTNNNSNNNSNSDQGYLGGQQHQTKASKYGSDYSHLPHIRGND
jgi:hypothetical protein